MLDKLNSYSADIVINTGDNTTDSLECEFEDAGNFLRALKCPNVFSIVGNHDKRNMRSQDFFRTYVDNIDLIRPWNPQNCNKNKIFLDQYTTGLTESFTDCNFVKSVTIKGKTILIVGLDTAEMSRDNGVVDSEMLNAVSREIEASKHDDILLLYHHSIIDTDSDPLFNSERIIQLVQRHSIRHTFCGHTHRLSIVESNDIINKHCFIQYKNGSLSSRNNQNDSNMFLYYENFGVEDMKLHLIRMFEEQSNIRFEEEIIITA